MKLFYVSLTSVPTDSFDRPERSEALYKAESLEVLNGFLRAISDSLRVNYIVEMKPKIIWISDKPHSVTTTHLEL